MTDTTLNRFLASGTAAERAAFTPTPATPASGPDPTYFWYETDTGNSYAWNFDTASWGQIIGGAWGTVTGTLSDQTDLQAAIDAKAALAGATFTGAVSATNLSGTNTGDQDLSGYATTAAVASAYQPLDSDLTAIAALTTATFGRSLLTQADAATARATLGVTGTTYASAAEIRTGTEAAKAVAPDQLAAAHVPVALTDAAPTTWNMANGFNRTWTLGANRTLSTPTNPKAGMTYVLEVIQDGTGGRTVTWPASFNWGAAGTPTLSTAANKVDLVTLYCRDAATPKFRAIFSKDA